MNAEIIGIIATIILIVAFIMKDIKKLRIVNSIGALVFIIYGFLISSYSIIIANFIFICINTYHLIRFRKKIVASQILDGYSVYVDGVKATGSILTQDKEL